MAAMPKRHAARLILIETVTVVRFHMGKPFQDRAGAAHEGCVKRTIEGHFPGPSWQHRTKLCVSNRFAWTPFDSGVCEQWLVAGTARSTPCPAQHGPCASALVIPGVEIGAA
jgi:hypothetical protein